MSNGENGDKKARQDASGIRLTVQAFKNKNNDVITLMIRVIRSVYTQAVNFPIGLAKFGGVVVDIVLTRVDTTTRRGPHIASPITAEGQVEDYLMRVKELVVIAIVRV